MLDIHQVLVAMLGKDASDLHLKVGNHPIMRIHQNLVLCLEWPVLTASELEEIAFFLLDQSNLRESFLEKKEIDFSYTLKGVGRFRTNIFRQRGSIGIIQRLVRTAIPTCAELLLPEIFYNIARYESGLIIITGSTSSGKSSTLAALIGAINHDRALHIMSIEDPIEFLHKDEKSIINQRELGIDTDSYENALKYIMRQDPDVIVIGDLRDAYSIKAALAAVETGHLVLSTMHMGETSQAVFRILEFFPAYEREQVRMQLAMSLSVITCQKLVPRVNGGLIPAVEVMMNTPTIKKLLKENKLEKLTSAVEVASDAGMQSFHEALADLLKRNLITQETALENATNPESFKMHLKGIVLDEAKRIIN